MSYEKPSAEQVVEVLSDFVNNYNADKEDFKRQFSRQHRTLQQSMLRLFLEVVEHVASDEYRTDGRNAKSKEVAQKLVGLWKSEQEKEIGMSFNPSENLPLI